MDGLSEQQIAALLLIGCGLVFAVSGILYTGRAIFKWPAGATARYLRWERGLVIAAVVLTVLGLALLDDLLDAAGTLVFARVGMLLYLFGAVIVVVAETNFLNDRSWNNTQVVTYILLAFLAQAAMGVALVQSDLVASWVGWVTILWNLAWPLGMLLVRPSDVYYPVLHHAAPFLIGIMLLVGR